MKRCGRSQKGNLGEQDGAILPLLFCPESLAAVAVQLWSKVESRASAFPASVWHWCGLGRQTRAGCALVKPILDDRFSELLPKAEFDFVTGTCLTAVFMSGSVLAVTVGVF